jgi:TM2 domain-containing membrane protein YozV
MRTLNRRTLNRNCFYLLFLIAISLRAKDPVLELADKFFDSGFYEEAITEYERYIHFDSPEKDVSYAYYKIGLSYRNLHNLRKSSNALESSAQSTSSDSVRDERKIDMAVNYIAGGQYSEAKFLLLKLLSFSKTREIRRKSALFLGVANLYTFQWESAKDALKAYFEEGGNTKFARTVDSLLSSAEKLSYKSPTTARWLSTFIPGAGQIYSGNAGDGINAMVLNGSIIYFITYKLLKEEYGNAYIIYFFLFRRYYFGNIYRATKGAIDYNRDLNEETADSIFSLLRNIEE